MRREKEKRGEENGIEMMDFSSIDRITFGEEIFPLFLPPVFFSSLSLSLFLFLSLPSNIDDVRVKELVDHREREKERRKRRKEMMRLLLPLLLIIIWFTGSNFFSVSFSFLLFSPLLMIRTLPVYFSLPSPLSLSHHY